ncbi:hypothetical protein V6N12_049165 [Hibiscus sabdariffa]|uniref:RNase H type-1 domain-containing protein n=1 Tax=Hibiscus sabdariffa TaxID=183260 RepID=A0ABR2EL33_9ROSI
MVTADGVWKWEVREWILANLRSPTRFSTVANWELLFGVVVWIIWLARNADVFNSPSIFHNSIIQSSRLLVERTMTAIREVNDGVRATLLRRSWEVHVLHVLRCDNSVADCLAKPANSDSTCVIYFEDPPPFIVQILQRDVASISVTHD